MTEDVQDETGVAGTAQGRVLVVAGSDSGAGAGIQADLKTVAALGGYATTAITAVTAQNTEGVSAVHPIPPDIVVKQMQAVLSDIGADAAKTGMLGDAALVEAVAGAFDARSREEGARPLPLVVDPVMVAASGAVLVEEGAVAAIRELMLPRAFLVTPNAPEAEQLTGVNVEDVDGQRMAGEKLIEMGATAALVKGGHLSGPQIMDVLVTPNGMRIFSRPRVRSTSTHGTGCTLASAIAALIALGRPLDKAVEEAGDYLHEAIRQAPGLGRGAGPVQHMWPLRAAALGA